MPHTMTSVGRKLSLFSIPQPTQLQRTAPQIRRTNHCDGRKARVWCSTMHGHPQGPLKGTPGHSRQSASSNAMPICNCVDIIHPDWKLLVFQGLQFTKVVTSTEKRAADNALSLRIRSGACAIQCFSIPVST